MSGNLTVLEGRHGWQLAVPAIEQLDPIRERTTTMKKQGSRRAASVSNGIEGHGGNSESDQDEGGRSRIWTS